VYETQSVPSAATNKVLSVSSRLRKLREHGSLMSRRAALARMELLNLKLLVRSMAWSQFHKLRSVTDELQQKEGESFMAAAVAVDCALPQSSICYHV
jgi:hypothetical protein